MPRPDVVRRVLEAEKDYGVPLLQASRQTAVIVYVEQLASKWIRILNAPHSRPDFHVSVVKPVVSDAVLEVVIIDLIRQARQGKGDFNPRDHRPVTVWFAPVLNYRKKSVI